MTTDKNIDQWFEDSLGEMKPIPSAQVWDGIEQQLNAVDSANIEFDQSFEQSLGGMSPFASTEAWNNIESALNEIDISQKKGKNKFIFWFSIAGSIAALFMYWFMQIGPNNQMDQPSALQQISDTKQELIVSTPAAGYSSSISINSSSNEIVEEEISSYETQIISPNNAIVSHTNNPNIANIETTTPIRSKARTELEKQQEISNDDLNLADTLEQSKNELVFAQSISNDILSHEVIDSMENITLPSPTEITSLRAATGFSLDLFAGPEYIMNNAAHSTNLEEGENISLEQTQAMNTDFSLGLNIKYHYNRFFIQSGLTYSNFGEQNTYKITNEFHDTSNSYYIYKINTYHTYDTIGWTDDPLQPGVIVPLLSSQIHTDTLSSTWNTVDSVYYNSYNEEVKNRYRYIEIPIMFGYQYEYKNWSFMAAGGVSYGFKVAEEGKYINDSHLETIMKTNSPYYNSNINGIVSLGIGYAITNNISVILQPTYKSNLTSLTSQNTTYSNFTLRAGLNVKL